MKMLMLALWPLILANVVMWYSTSHFISFVWAAVLIGSPMLLPERRWNP